MDKVENIEERIEKSDKPDYFSTHPEIYYG
jgi:hypothetical protein